MPAAPVCLRKCRRLMAALNTIEALLGGEGYVQSPGANRNTLLLAAAGNMLAASDDVIDLIHSHPYQADGGADMQFRMYFPRPKGYRIWFQFQKKGVVNTAYFDVPVKELD